MPYINISTLCNVEDKKNLVQEISILFSSLTGKPTKFVMAKLEDNSQIYFADENACCLLEIKSIGSINPSEMTKPLCNFIFEKLGIPLDKIYIIFKDFPASMWGWNGKTFG